MKPNSVALVCVTVVAVVTIAGAVSLVIAAPAGQDLGILIGLMFTGAASLIASIVTLARTEQIKGTVDDLANGKMDAKIRAAVADVMEPHLIREDAHDQIRQDRARR